MVVDHTALSIYLYLANFNGCTMIQLLARASIPTLVGAGGAAALLAKRLTLEPHPPTPGTPCCAHQVPGE